MILRLLANDENALAQTFLVQAMIADPADQTRMGRSAGYLFAASDAP
jgi:hypothetical protein